MERLTTKREADAQREAYERRIKQGYPRNIPEERFLRLAAYEDTGLTPEGLEAIKTSLMGKSLAEWVNAKERLPESPGRYLTVSTVPKYGARVVDILRFDGAWIWRGHLEIIVTHWMPLPEPPKEE